MISSILKKISENPVETMWVVFGFAAQSVFAARFIVQWFASEKAGRSIMPIAFWYLSLLGGGMLLAYAIHLREPVFILGQATGFFIYARNLYLILSRERKK